MGPIPPTLLDHLRLLADAGGRAPAAPDAPLWGELFAPPSPYTSLPAAALEEAVGGYFEMLGEFGCGKAGERAGCHTHKKQNLPTLLVPSLASHAPTTRNFESLLRAAADAITDGVVAVGPHPAAVAAARRGADAAALARALLKLAAERVEPARLTTLVATAGGADALAAAVVAGLGAPSAREWPQAPFSPFLYSLRLELTHLALVLASGPLYAPAGAPGRHPLSEAVLRQRGGASAAAVAGLLTTIAAAPLPPPGTPLARDDGGEGGEMTPPGAPPPSRVARIMRVALCAARRAAAVLLGRPAPPPPGSRGPLADAAAAALLVLLHTAPPAGGAGSPYVASLAATVDSDAAVRGAPSAPLAAVAAALASGNGTDADALLTYALLRGCPSFGDCVLRRSPEVAAGIALPLLRALHTASPRAPPSARAPPPPPARAYMLLVNCLVLTQEPAFCTTAAAPVPRGGASFYRDGALGAAPPLATLATAVLLRAAHAALGRGRDVYQLTTALAAAANLAPAAAPLPAHVASRAVRLLERLAARHARLTADGDADEGRVYEELTRVALELVNAALAAALGGGGGGASGGNGGRAIDPAAADVVYALLHRGDALAPLATHPRFADLAANIEAVVAFFGGRVEAAARRAAGGDADDSGGATLSDTVTAASALASVRAALPDWPAGGLAPLPDLRFSYEEEADAASFFVPAAWAAALRATRARIAWTPPAIALFPASDAAAVAAGAAAKGLDLAEAAALASTASLDSVAGGASVV